MDHQIRAALVIGAVVGFALAAFFYYHNNQILDFLLVPFTAVMGAAPYLLKPKDD